MFGCMDESGYVHTWNNEKLLHSPRRPSVSIAYHCAR
jgi:hypothetical protein